MGFSFESSLYLAKDFYDEMESSLKNNTDLDIKKISEKLCSFCFSESFIPFIYCEFLFQFQNFLSIFEMKEKFLSLKILIPLLEELKKKNFEKHIETIIKNKENIFKQFIKNQEDSINKFSKSEEYQRTKGKITFYKEKLSIYLNSFFGSNSKFFV